MDIVFFFDKMMNEEDASTGLSYGSYVSFYKQIAPNGTTLTSTKFKHMVVERRGLFALQGKVAEGLNV